MQGHREKATEVTAENVSFYSPTDVVGQGYDAGLRDGTELEDDSGRRYTLLKKLGTGATSIAYGARDLTGSRDVAIKVLHPWRDVLLDECGCLMDGDVLRRFRSQSSGHRLVHDNLLTVWGYGSGEIEFSEASSHWVIPPFVVTDLGEGGTLAKRLQSATKDERTDWTVAILRGLAYMHEQGILHRDIKPANIFFLGGRLVIGDIGVAFWGKHTGSSTTPTEEVLGTIRYYPPSHIYPRSPWLDVHSMGATVAELWGFKWTREPFANIAGSDAFKAFLGDVPKRVATLIQRSVRRSWNRYYDARDALAEFKP